MKNVGLIFIIGIFIIATIGLSGCYEKPSVNKDYDVYITDAPFGKYWIHTWGRAILFSGSSTRSELEETYTIKFFNGSELKTLILESTDARLHVILTDDNVSMRINIKLIDCYLFPDSEEELNRLFLYGVNGGLPSNYAYIYTLYIPKPEICVISDGVIE